MPGHRPGPKPRPVGRGGWAGRSGRSSRSVMIQLPIYLFRSGLTLLHPIAEELSVRTSPAKKQRFLGRRARRVVPYLDQMTQACTRRSEMDTLGEEGRPKAWLSAVFLFSRNVGWFTLKVVYFCYLKKTIWIKVSNKKIYYF